MDTLKLILLIFQMISCVVLTVVIILQNGAEDGLGAIAGGSDTYLGKGKAGTLDAKLSRLTKWVAAVFVLLTLFVALLGALQDKTANPPACAGGFFVFWRRSLQGQGRALPGRASSQ